MTSRLAAAFAVLVLCTARPAAAQSLAPALHPASVRLHQAGQAVRREHHARHAPFAAENARLRRATSDHRWTGAAIGAGVGAAAGAVSLVLLCKADDAGNCVGVGIVGGLGGGLVGGLLGGLIGSAFGKDAS